MKRPSAQSGTLDNGWLEVLLNQDESSTLEFKQEWYKLEEDREMKRRQQGELIKDILALANGCAYSAGETAFLVVGVGNQRDADGSRNVFDVGPNIPTATSILQMVRPYTSPPLETLEVMPVSIRSGRLFVIVIPPSPHLYETTRQLDTPSRRYSNHVVFVRRNEMVDIASAWKREVIERVDPNRSSRDIKSSW